MPENAYPRRKRSLTFGPINILQLPTEALFRSPGPTVFTTHPDEV